MARRIIGEDNLKVCQEKQIKAANKMRFRKEQYSNRYTGLKGLCCKNFFCKIYSLGASPLPGTNAVKCFL